MSRDAALPVTDLPVDDVAWAWFGPSLRMKIARNAYTGFCVELTTDNGDGTGKGHRIQLPWAASGLPGLIEHADKVVGDARMVADGNSDVPWPHEWDRTKVRLLGAVDGGFLWIPLAEIPEGVDRSWRLIRLRFPDEMQQTGWWDRVTSFFRRAFMPVNGNGRH